MLLQRALDKIGRRFSFHALCSCRMFIQPSLYVCTWHAWRQLNIFALLRDRKCLSFFPGNNAERILQPRNLQLHNRDFWLNVPAGTLLVNQALFLSEIYLHHDQIILNDSRLKTNVYAHLQKHSRSSPSSYYITDIYAVVKYICLHKQQLHQQNVLRS